MVEVHLAEQEGGTPDVVLEHQHVSQVQFDPASDVEGQTRHVDSAVQEGLGGCGVVQVEGEQSGPVGHQAGGFRGLTEVLQRGAVLVGEVEGSGGVEGKLSRDLFGQDAEHGLSGLRIPGGLFSLGRNEGVALVGGLQIAILGRHLREFHQPPSAFAVALVECAHVGHGAHEVPLLVEHPDKELQVDRGLGMVL